MKKSDIERQLKKDLSASAPSDFEAVWEKCSTPAAEVGNDVGVTAGGAAMRYSRKSLLFSIAAAAALLLIAAALCIVFLGKSDGGLLLPSNSGYFIIDINPSVQVNYDENGVVTVAKGLNGDGEELIDGLELGGMTYDKAADAIFERCVSFGYFKEGVDNAILMTASGASGEKDEKMTAELNKLLSQKFTAKNMSGVVISDVDNAKGEKEADKYGISGQKYELIQTYLSNGGKLDEDEYEAITIKELYSRISELDKNKKDK